MVAGEVELKSQMAVLTTNAGSNFPPSKRIKHV